MYKKSGFCYNSESCGSPEPLASRSGSGLEVVVKKVFGYLLLVDGSTVTVMREQCTSRNAPVHCKKW